MRYRWEDGNFDIGEYLRKLPTLRRRRGNPGTRSANWEYKDIVTAFDIETTLYKIGEHYGGTAKEPKLIIDYVGIMYIWQFQLGPDITIYGRTWDEFTDMINSIVDALTDGERLLIFVHNLSYEWQWLRDPAILGNVLDEESVFMVESRMVLKFQAFAGRLDFHCSYLHSNMSLDEWTDKLQVEHGKLSGDEYDYSKQRFSWTPMTEKELEYCFNDVQGLVECVYKEMRVDGDNLYSLPLTSTGYVRRDIKKAIRLLPHNYITKLLPCYTTYRLLREAFRGGNTHASRFYANRRVDGDIWCMDIASSYPNVMLNQMYPVTPFHEIERDHLTIDHILGLVAKGRAVIMRLALWNVRLRDEFWPVPYLAREKCRNIVNADYDNGRIIRADYLEVTVTDIDLQILIQEYEFELEENLDGSRVVLYAEFASYGYLPYAIRDVIREYFTLKTTLKGDEAQKIYYDKAKAKLNSIYGMTAQNPVKLDEVYRAGDYLTGVRYKENGEQMFISQVEADLQAIDLYKFAHEQNIEKSTMPYQWGVWCCAWARKMLEDAIEICGTDFLYCDTDSVYYIGDHDFSGYNKQRMKDSLKNRAYADDSKGKRHYTGVLETDKHMTSFKSMGAKKYAYIADDGKLHITIAGVSKSKGADELTDYAKEYGLKDGLDAMEESFVFQAAGGTESVYNDYSCTLNIEGHEVYVPYNISIKPSTYKISLGGDYKTLLNFLLDNDLFRLYQIEKEGGKMPSLEI